MNEQTAFEIFETKLGFVALAWDHAGLSGLRLPARSAAAAQGSLLKRLPRARRGAPPPSVAATIADVVRYFEGETIDFSDVRVNLGPQEPFFASVYAEVRKLRWGETTTYGTVARTLDAEPQAARDVGQAMAANPIPLIIPCHRVLAAGGKIGGFSAPGGSAAKAKMLAMEGVAPASMSRPRKPSGSPAQQGFCFEPAPQVGPEGHPDLAPPDHPLPMGVTPF